MTILECFETLGLEPGAALKEIQQAHRDLVKVWHPDRFRHDPRLQLKAQEQLKKINVAYDKLMMHHFETQYSSNSSSCKRDAKSESDSSTDTGQKTSDTGNEPKENAETFTPSPSANPYSIIIASIALIATSIGILLIACSSYYVDVATGTAEQLGAVVGYSVQFAIVSYLIWHFLLKKRKGLGLLCYSMMVVCLCVYKSVLMFHEAKQSQAALMAMGDIVSKAYSDDTHSTPIDSPSPTSPLVVLSSPPITLTTTTLPPPAQAPNAVTVPSVNSQAPRYSSNDYGETAVLLQYLDNYMRDYKTQFANMNDELQSQDIASLLSPQTFSSSVSILLAQQRLQSINEILQRYEQYFRNRVAMVDTDINSLDISESMKQHFRTGFNRTKDDGLNVLLEFFSIEKAIVTECNKLMTFMSARIGSYEVTDKQVLFVNTTDLQIYQQYIRNITVLAQKESAWIARGQQRSKNMADKMARLKSLKW